MSAADSEILIIGNNAIEDCKKMYEEYGNNRQSSRYFSLLQSLTWTLLIVLLLSCQLFSLNHKLEEERNFTGSNWTSIEPVQAQEDAFLTKAVSTTLLISTIPPLLILTFADPLDQGFEKTKKILTVFLSLLLGCSYGTLINFFYETTSGGISEFSRRLHEYASVSALNHCGKVKPEILSFGCFASYDFARKVLPEGWLGCQFDHATDLCPKVFLFFGFVFASLLASTAYYAIVHLELLYQLKLLVEERAEDYAKSWISHDFSFSFIGGLAIGTGFFFNNSFGIFTCLCVLFHKVMYQLRDFKALRKLGYSKFKISMLFLLTAVVALLGTCVPLLADDAVIEWMKICTLFYLYFPCHFIIGVFMVDARHNKFLVVIIGTIMMVLAAEYADPKKYYLINVMNQLNTYYYA